MKPTKARIELMQAISDGAVSRHYPIGLYAVYDEWDFGPGHRPRHRKVDKRVADFAITELVRLGRPATDQYKAARLWELTPAGEAWLKANGGSTS